MSAKKKKTGGKKKETTKLIIGQQDKVDLPSFGFEDVPCKTDTGARTNSIHCHRVKLVERRGKEILSFMLLDPSHSDFNRKEFRTTEFKERKIKNSFGESEYRYVINTTVRLFGKNYETEFTLSDRENMRFPILLGGRFLRRRFLVDVSKKDLSYKEKLKNRKSDNPARSA